MHSQKMVVTYICRVSWLLVVGVQTARGGEAAIDVPVLGALLYDKPATLPRHLLVGEASTPRERMGLALWPITQTRITRSLLHHDHHWETYEELWSPMAQLMLRYLNTQCTMGQSRPIRRRGSGS